MRRYHSVGVMSPDSPQLSAMGQGWVGTRTNANVDYELTVTDVLRHAFAENVRCETERSECRIQADGARHNTGNVRRRKTKTSAFPKMRVAFAGEGAQALRRVGRG